MEYLKPILAGLDLGKNVKCHAHILDSIVVPRDFLTKPILEQKCTDLSNTSLKAPMAERSNTSDIDLSGFVRIAMGHDVLTEYRRSCYKHLTGVKFPVYTVVLLNEMKQMCKGRCVLTFIDEWLNNPTNNLGNGSQFKETLGCKFEKVSDIVNVKDCLYPPVTLKPPRPCPFNTTVTEEDLVLKKCFLQRENIQLILYEMRVCFVIAFKVPS